MALATHQERNEKTPIEYTIRIVQTAAVVRGFETAHNDFRCTPYEQRSELRRADYDKLEASIGAHGISDPIIVWKHPDTGQLHALIGMRRHEIAWKLGIAHLEVAVIHEDIRQWTGMDVTRITTLKRALGQREY